MKPMMKGLLIGCGFFARNHLHGWRETEGAGITAVCDLQAERAQRYASEFSIPTWHDSADALGSGSYDFVDICTTMDTHEELVGLAVRHGVPVIVQKPLAPDIETCRRIAKTADAANVPVMVHENFRFQKIFRRVHEILRTGEIGELTFGRLSWRNAIDVYSNQPYLLKTERFMIMDVGIHMIDLARYLFGEAETVSCLKQSTRMDLAGEDAAIILLHHENNATSIIDVSYASQRHPNPFPQTRGEIEGRLGTIEIIEDQRLVIHSQGGQRRESIKPDGRSWTSEPWVQIQDSVPRTQQHFIDALCGGRAFETSLDDSLKTYAIAEAAYRSAETGRRIKTTDV